MQQIIQILIGAFILLTGVFVGSFLSKQTKEELKSGQIWFKLIIVSSLIGAVFGLIFKNDVLLFSFLFISIVTSRSLRK